MSETRRWIDMVIAAALAAAAPTVFGVLAYRYNYENLAISNRAWLVPQSAEFADSIGAMSRIAIKLINEGKSVAVAIGQADVETRALAFERFRGAPYVDSVVVKWPVDSICPWGVNDPQVEPLAPLYPSQSTVYVRHIPASAYDAMTKDNLHLIVVRGCFVYSDPYGARMSPYCFYSVPKEAGQSGFEKELRSCPRGAQDPS